MFRSYFIVVLISREICIILYNSILVEIFGLLPIMKTLSRLLSVTVASYFLIFTSLSSSTSDPTFFTSFHPSLFNINVFSVLSVLLDLLNIF